MNSQIPIDPCIPGSSGSIGEVPGAAAENAARVTGPKALHCWSSEKLSKAEQVRAKKSIATSWPNMALTTYIQVPRDSSSWLELCEIHVSLAVNQMSDWK